MAVMEGGAGERFWGSCFWGVLNVAPNGLFRPLARNSYQAITHHLIDNSLVIN